MKTIKRSIMAVGIVFAMLATILLGDVRVYAAGAGSTKSATESTGATLDQMMVACEFILSQSYGKNYTISRKDNLVTINVWADGIAAGAAGVQAGTVAKKDWTTMTNNMAKFSESAYNLFKSYDVSVNVNILNDLNKENVLVSYLNGVKVYDVIEE